METAHSAKWTTDDIRKLLEAMKKSIQKREQSKIWSVGLKTLDWNKIAFEDFTAEECSAKWLETMQKLRKIKTITELIVDAQNAIDDTNSKLQLGPAKTKIPKKPVSANALFFAENKEILKKKNPGMNSRELMKFANDSYKKLPPAKKEKYLQNAQKSKEEYQQNLQRLQQEELMRNGEDEEMDTAFCFKKKKRVKLPGNGYNLFCREQKSRLTGVPRSKITVTWSRRWRELPAEEKIKYSRRCKEMRKEAKRKQKGVDIKEVDENKFPGEPKMPTRSICGLYCKSQMKKMKGKVKGSRNRFGVASHQSKNLSQQEKEKYQAIINNNFSKYKEQLHRWFETLTPTQQQEYCQQNPKKLKYLGIKRQLRTPFHRTSDSEDEELEESSSTDRDYDDYDDYHHHYDDDILEVIIGEEEEEMPMFDLF